jgi:hypothetical protein
LLHGILSVLTVGLWALFWLIAACLRKPWRCAHCGLPIAADGRASTAAVRTAIVLPLAFLLLVAAAIPVKAFIGGLLSEEPKPLPAVAKSDALPASVGSWQPKSTPIEDVETAFGEEPQITREEPRITLKDPRISIQTAVVRISEAAGLKYDWQRSFDRTSPKCRTYISVDLKETPLSDALDEVVTKNGLSYHIQDGKISLDL